MKFFKFGKAARKSDEAAAVQTVERQLSAPLARLASFSRMDEYELYSQLRESIPVIDAALDKIVRLIGNFTIRCPDKQVEDEINRFFDEVRCCGSDRGFHRFQSVYMNQLLTYGTAAGEIVLTKNGRDIYSLVNVPLKNIRLGFDEGMVDVLMYPAAAFGDKPFEHQELLLFSVLNPEPGRADGVSLLRGLKFVSDILLKIYDTIGTNWERVGNVRFAVTYKPGGDGDRSMSRQRAQQIADEWSKAMRDKTTVSDFVSVGDVSVKVIGADNQILDSEIPVREMLEQIVAKLSVPPFLLGLSWNTTERMSSQQADILTSELEYYRSVFNEIILKIAYTWQRLHGFDERLTVEWENISLQDELDLAKALLYRTQAETLKQSFEEGALDE